MKDRTDEEIKNERKEIAKRLELTYDDEINIIDSFFEDAPRDAKPLWYLGKSIQLLADADIAYFAKGWEDYRGCRIEYTCAKEYGIGIIKEWKNN